MRKRHTELLLALGPAMLIAIFQLSALLLALLGGSRDPVEAAIYALYAGLVIGLVIAISPLFICGRGAWPLCLISLCATAVALIFGFAIWAEAAHLACHGVTDCPFG